MPGARTREAEEGRRLRSMLYQGKAEVGGTKVFYRRRGK
jgi:hypothetical protein